MLVIRPSSVLQPDHQRPRKQTGAASPEQICCRREDIFKLYLTFLAFKERISCLESASERNFLAVDFNVSSSTPSSGYAGKEVIFRAPSSFVSCFCSKLWVSLVGWARSVEDFASVGRERNDVREEVESPFREGAGGVFNIEEDRELTEILECFWRILFELRSVFPLVSFL